jgi:osmotically-inducible protein OsmY
MATRKLLFCFLTIVVLSGAMAGCATVETYRKCGFSGCLGDSDITARVQGRFERYTVLQPPNLIRVQTLDHVVYLTGIVNTPPPRDLAGSVAAQVPGVRRVVNSISLEYQGR